MRWRTSALHLMAAVVINIMILCVLPRRKFFILFEGIEFVA